MWLGTEYLRDFVVTWDDSNKVYLLKIDDVYANIDLTLILVVLICLLVLVSVCIILMVRHERKSAKADIIRTELERRHSLRKKSDL